MAMQLLVGVPLEMVHGALRIGLVYMCGVLAGGCALAYTHKLQSKPLSIHTDIHTFSLPLFHLLVVHFSCMEQPIRLQPLCGILVTEKI